MGEFERKPFDDIGTDTNIPADSEREFSAKIADVDIRDDFMFSYVMCNPQICIELLQYLLPAHKISRIEYYEMGRDGTEQPTASSPKGEPLKLDIQKSLNEAFNRRTVRLDVYIDDGKSVYNLEMQTTRHAGLPQAGAAVSGAHGHQPAPARAILHQTPPQLRDLHLHL